MKALRCLHLLRSSVLLFKHPLRPDLFRISSFSVIFGPSGSSWSKKNGTFDVTMGSFDGAEVCELVGLFLLKKITGFTPPEKVGLYRDDGLIMLENIDGPSTERLRKKLHATFQQEGLKITIENPSTVVDFLDVTFNCSDGSYRPFRKENSVTEYVNKYSNHPPQIIKRIPEIVQKRLSTISSTEEIFEESKHFYEECLQRSGYINVELKFTPTPEGTSRNKRNRSRSYGLIRHGVKVSPPTLVRNSSVSLRNTSHVVTDTEVL